MYEETNRNVSALYYYRIKFVLIAELTNVGSSIVQNVAPSNPNPINFNGSFFMIRQKQILNPINHA